MSTSLDRYEVLYYLSGDRPANAPDTWGKRLERNQQGFKRTTGDRPNIVLPYSGIRYTGKTRYRGSDPGFWGYGPGHYGDFPYTGNHGWVTGMPPWMAQARNRAYESFKEAALGDSTQLGTLLAERKEAYGMVANRVTGLYRSYRDLRKGDFKGFLKNLSVDPKRKHRSKLRSAANEASGLWLEYWFGWSPTVNDLYGLSSVLAGSPPDQRYHGSGSSRLPLTQVNSGSSSAMRYVQESGKLVVKTGATVRLVNPDAQLLQQMGLQNPAAIAWEVIPFSFVVDWFTKFGDVISAFTDFVGVELIDPYWSMYANTDVYFQSGVPGDITTFWGHDMKLHRMVRYAHLVSPVATRPSFINYGQSKTRAATAVSLLTQIFLSGQK